MASKQAKPRPGSGAKRRPVLVDHKNYSFATPLLKTESPAEFQALRQDFRRDVRPHGIIEEMYVDEVVNIVWEMMRLRRCKTAMINAEVHAALVKLLTSAVIDYQICTEEDDEPYTEDDVEQLADAWFKDASGRDDVLRLLQLMNLDEMAIEVEVFRQTNEEVEAIDKILTALEVRRDRLLGMIGAYRESLAHVLCRTGNRLIEQEAKRLPILSNAGLKTAPD